MVGPSPRPSPTRGEGEEPRRGFGRRSGGLSRRRKLAVRPAVARERERRAAGTRPRPASRPAGDRRPHSRLTRRRHRSGARLPRAATARGIARSEPLQGHGSRRRADRARCPGGRDGRHLRRLRRRRRDLGGTPAALHRGGRRPRRRLHPRPPEGRLRPQPAGSPPSSRWPLPPPPASRSSCSTTTSPSRCCQRPPR